MSEQELKEYEICKVRGHTSSGVIASTAGTISAPATLTCKYCHISYHYTEPQLVEHNPPKDSSGAKDE